jgi:hypothetical protein
MKTCLIAVIANNILELRKISKPNIGPPSALFIPESGYSKEFGVKYVLL